MPAWFSHLAQLLALPEFGLSTVFVVAFISATLLPMGSEPAVFGLVKLNPDLFWPAVLVATAGNTLGGAVSWLMGAGTHRVVDRARGAPTELRDSNRDRRLKALLRRSLGASTDVLTLGPLSIDPTAQAVRLSGAVLELTAFEYRLLEHLVRQRPAIVTRQALSDYLYPHGEDRDSNVLEVLVGRLRRKLDPDGSVGPIETVRGRGYRFTLE